MAAISVSKKIQIKKILSDLSKAMAEKTNAIGIQDFTGTPFTDQLFSQNKESHIFYVVSQRITRSFVTKLGIDMEMIALLILEDGGSTNIRTKEDAKPFDLKFKHPDGNEYWVEMKSIFGQNKSNSQTIREEARKARGAGKKFLLCVYNENKEDKDEVLSGPDFWNFIGNDTRTWDELSEILTEAGKHIQFEKLINPKIDLLMKEFLD